MGELIGQLHDLPVRDQEYAKLYAQCMACFPNAIAGIPKPEYRTGPITSTYMYQPALPPPLPPSHWSTPAAAPVPPTSASATASYFCFGPCPETCAFCHAEGHCIRMCPTASEYLNSRHVTIINEHLHLPNSQPIPFDGTRCGLKASVDAWLTMQTPAPTVAQTCTIFMRESLLHFDSHSTSTS